MTNKVATCDEITINCQTCNEKIPVNVKLDHQRHHKALKTLKYKDQNGASSVEALLKRRKQILKKIFLKYEESPKEPDLERRINKVDEAFDAARSELVRGKGVYTTLNPLIEKFRVKNGGLNFSEEEIHHDVKSSPVWGRLPGCVNSVGTSYAKNIQNSDRMEDRMTTHPQFVSLDRRKEMKSSSFFMGVYDGHRGHQAAELTQSYLHHYIKEEIEEEKSFHLHSPLQKIPTKEEIEKTAESFNQGLITEDESDAGTEEASPQKDDNLLSNEGVLRGCKRAFKRMDDYLSWGINETSKVRWSACSVAACLIDDVIDSHEAQDNDRLMELEKHQEKEIGRLWMANTGSVEAYLSHNNKPYPLTQKHTCDNEFECERVEKMGGKIVSHGRNKLVNGVVSTTRGLGNHGDVPLRRCVTCYPYTSTARITGRSQFAVIATASVWSTFSVEEVFSLVRSTERHVEELQKQKQKSIIDEKNINLLHPPGTVLPEYDSASDLSESEKSLSHQIEEVEIVYPAEDDDDDDDDDDDKSASNKRDFETMENHIARLTRRSKHANSMTGLAYNTWLAAAMSSRIVQAAVQAGTRENVSAAVILFKGYFN